MEAPEYLDLDEIDFSDDISYSVTSLKTIPELCRRCDSQNEDRSVSSSSWNCGVSALIGNAQKPTGIADVCNKFRPVKRVSPLKHQPESSENNESDDQKNQKGEYQKGNDSQSAPPSDDQSPGEGESLKSKNIEPAVLLGELEHYDLDMDEILDVPYIKSSQQLVPFTKVASEKKLLGVCSTVNGLSSKTCSAANTESSPASSTQFCVLSPVKGSQLRKTQPIVLDQHKHLTEELELSQPVVKCSSVHESEARGKGFLSRTFVNPHAHKTEKTVPNCHLRTFHLQTAVAENKQLEELSMNWSSVGGPEERSEEVKKIKSILNIVKEGQISLLPHLAADNLDKIHDEYDNNLLHVAASKGHAECLQHLTSLMGEDCLNERNIEQLTPAGLAIKNGQLECVRWMVSETEAIAELSCSKDHPSLIHYAGCYGQEKILLWLLQFMQEQGISLDEVDQDGNTAVHIAAQHGYLGCIQTLVEYGANVTMQNHVGEKPSQSAERHGHTMCSRYLVVVETCMSLASQVVKLTKQLKEQTVERVTLQNQLQQLLEAQRSEGKSLPTSPSLPSSPASGKPPWKPSEADELSPPKSKLNTQDGIQILGSLGTSSRTRAKTKDEDSDKILRQLLGKEISENVCMQEKLTLEFQDAHASSKNVKKILPEKRELKLARLRQLMQRSLSESDTDSANSEDHKNTPMKRTDKPRPQPIVESVESTESLHLMIKKHTSAGGRRFPFGIRVSKSVDGHSPSPTSESSDPDNEAPYQPGAIPQSQFCGDNSPSSMDAAQKVATSPKSALKSPSSKRRTSQNLKLRVTFEEPVVQVELAEPELNEEKDKDRGKGLARAPPASGETAGDQLKKPFGTFRSIMETLSGNQNNNNNCQTANLIKTSSTLPFTSLGRKTADSKGNPAALTKGKNKPGPYFNYTSLSSSMLNEELLCNYACVKRDIGTISEIELLLASFPVAFAIMFYLRRHIKHDDINWESQKPNSQKSTEEPELQEFFL
ncbi:synphilin-1 isoform X1 [Strigops habroptila]|uniref:synphilin-1 isoform X1 n=2 Tax=Strigops habroptila TaxID=2489341 RepID=UPI0011CFDD56|nr:synphilin-1 isoform X1 [Strigops habroptila]XP_030325997.1 synphilin-1 isoform X1 [Strigops habroptila]XP_030325998.1 synphilin-1 isoform X1 [Strigops habroptila]